MTYKDGSWGIKAKIRSKNRNNYFKKYQGLKRKKLISMMGGKCLKCGFKDIRALQVDHINGGGNHERRKLGPLYWGYVLKSLIGKEGKYQLLCANCNSIKRYENNEMKGGILR